MLTRCPKCATTFRVTPEQIKARQGRVRCGECQEVFNALDTLIEEPQAIIQVVAAPAHAQRAAEPEVATEPPPAPTRPEPEPDEAEMASQAMETVLEPPPSHEIDRPEALAGISTPEESEPAEAVEFPVAEPALEPLLHEEPTRRTAWPWLVGSLIALAALVVQVALYLRTEIAVLYPAAKPALVAACDAFGCKVLLPRKPELVGIDSSDLHPDVDGKLALSATLRNRAPFAQEYPHLELALTDTSDQPLVRRVLAPADYLPAQTRIAAGFPASSDLAINLSVDPTGIPAVGYRLYLFYP